MNFEVKGGSLKISFKNAKATFMKDADSTMSILFEGEDKITINRPGEYEYSSIHFQNIEDKEANYLGKVDVSKVTGVRNTGILIVSKESELSKEALTSIDHVNVLIPLTSNISSIATLVKRFTPEVLIIPSSIEGIDVPSKDISKMVKDINITEEKEKSLSFKSADFNSEEDLITNVYFI